MAGAEVVSIIRTVAKSAPSHNRRRAWVSLLILVLARLWAVIFQVASLPTVAFAQDNGFSPDFERCRVIKNDQARLECLKSLLQQAPEPPPRAPWQFVRTRNPAGGADAVSIMRTADTKQSDPDLAGLMIRCDEKLGFAAALALVRPLPPHAKRDVTLTWSATNSSLQAEASPSGTTLILPAEVTAFVQGPWQQLSELSVVIKDPDGEIRGTIPLDGLAPAMTRLSANCPEPR